jgi:hypothetical protein
MPSTSLCIADPFVLTGHLRPSDLSGPLNCPHAFCSLTIFSFLLLTKNIFTMYLLHHLLFVFVFI